MMDGFRSGLTSKNLINSFLTDDSFVRFILTAASALVSPSM